MNYENGSVCPVSNCTDSQGTLPSCAGLAVPYVPFQQDGPQKYNPNEALSNGTLFPGLNLPFHKMVDGSKLPNVPMTELQALEFVLLELGAYLDTHPEDMEAFELFKQFSTMACSSRTGYEKKFGPLTRSADTGKKSQWLNDPWPWNYQQNEVK